MTNSVFFQSNIDFSFIMIVLIFGLVVVSLAITFAHKQAVQRAWNELAERNGLSFEAGSWFQPPSVSGLYRGRSLVLDTFSRGSGKSRTTYTRVRLPLRSATGLTLEIYEETVFNRIGKALGMKEIETGDQELDYRFVFKGQPENDILRLLMQVNLRQKLLDTPSLNIKLKDSALTYERRGQQMDGEYLEAVFSLLSDLADRVEAV